MKDTIIQLWIITSTYMNLGFLLLAGLSIVFAAHTFYSSLLKLYAWEDENAYLGIKAPRSYDSPRFSFSILVPARNEEEVIQDTIQSLVNINYPPQLLQILVIAEETDTGTIRKTKEKLQELEASGVRHVHLVSFTGEPITKPHSLNVGLARATNQVVVVFDAEDEPHRDILNIVNTVMAREGSPIVQCGVQLMNYADHWFSALNVLEYFFWYKSRMHFQAALGMILLGGNTAFIERDLLERLSGWDQSCLTEDADFGIRASVENAPIRAIYEGEYVTREETPHTIADLIRQRTRWNQGFLQVLAKGDWLRLPSWSQRIFAFFSLSFPIFQVLTLTYIPLGIWGLSASRVPILVAMLSTLPLYALFFDLCISVVGLHEFAAIYKLRLSLLSSVVMILAYMPYQWILSFAALRALWRRARGFNNWEKTKHIGAHRTR